MTVNIERVGDRIHAKVPWDGGQGRDKAKSVAGHRWDPEAKVWTYPLAWDVCVALRAVFGKQLKIGPQLWKWAQVAKAENAKLAYLADNPLAEVKLLSVERHAPKLASALRPYQATGASYVAQGKHVIVADEMRLGKTLESLAGIVQAKPQGGNFLVFAPKTAVLATWAPEVKRWLGDSAEVVALTGDRKKREAALDYAALIAKSNYRRPYLFVLANTEMVRITGVDSSRDMKSGTPRFPVLFEIAWDGIVADESHTALVHVTGTPTQTRTGMVRLAHLNPDALRVALSGTPFRGKLHQLWGTLNWLKPKEYTSYWRWVANYFEVIDNGFGKDIGGLLESRRQAFYSSLSTVMIRRTMREVRAEIPAHIYCGTPLDGDTGPVAIWLPMAEKQAKQYQQMISQAMLETEGGEITANNVLSIMMRAKQLANSCLNVASQDLVMPVSDSNKADWILEKIAESDEKLVIASQFTRFINYLAEQIKPTGTQYRVITGDIKDADRAAAQYDFQNDPDVRVMLLNTKAGGVSLTLDAASIIIVCDETWIPDDQAQVEARITPTKGGPDTPAPTVYALRSRGTIDEGIARSNLTADDIIKAAMDKRRGVSVLRQVVAPGEEASKASKSTHN